MKLSIRDIQINRALKKIMLKELQSGVGPSDQTLDFKLDKYFNKYLPGYPSLNILKAESRKIMSSEDYNSMLDEIDDDLQVLYMSLLQQNMQIINNFIYHEEERNNAVRKIYTLNLMMDELLTKTENTNNYFERINEGFSDFINTDIDKTTSFVDLEFNHVSLMPNINKVSQISTTNADISISSIIPGEIENKEISKLSNCLDDYLNSSWMHKIVLPEKEDNNEHKLKEVGIELLVLLEKEVEISQIELISNTNDTTYVTISALINNNWVDLNLANIELKEKEQFDFDSIETDQVKIMLKKEVSPYNNSNILFSLKDISFYYNTYKQKGEYFSKAFKLKNKAVDKINLIADEVIPKDCYIDYYLDIKESGHNDFNLVDLKITPDNRDNNKEYIDLNTTGQRSYDFNNNKIIRSTEDDSYNIRFYKFNKKLDKSIIKDQTELYKGVKKWRREVFQYFRNNTHNISVGDFAYKPVHNDDVLVDYVDNMDSKITEYFDYYPGKTNYDLSYNYIDKSSVEVFYYSGGSIKKLNSSNYTIKDHSYSVSNSLYNTKSYISFSNTLSDSNIYFVKYHAKHINYKFTTYVYSDKSQDFKTRSLPSYNEMKLDLGEMRSFYVNNKNISPIIASNRNSYYYEGSLNKGWNKLIYVGYLEDTKLGLVQNNYFLNFNVTDNMSDSSNNDKVECSKFRAKKSSLSYVPYYDFINTKLKDENDFFTINKDSLILNTPIVNNYRLKTLENQSLVDEIRLRAYQGSENQFLSPKLGKVELNFFYER
jgi:hypothetical protein